MVIEIKQIHSPSRCSRFSLTHIYLFTALIKKKVTKNYLHVS